MTLRAGFHGTVGQPSAQVIDGSLKFDGSKPTYLKRTFSAGNQRTWTWSAWVRRDVFGQRHNLFGAPNTDSNGHYIEFRSTDKFQLEDYAGSLDFIRTLDQVSRDIGWFHWVVVQDTTESTDNNKIKIYKNGVLQTDTSALTHPSTNEEGAISRAAEHRIGVFPINLTEANFDGAMSQVYFIDGQALGPEYFGFTDPLTNTWRPKKAKTSGPNVGTTWSSVSTISSGGAAGGKPLSNGFDGSISNAFEGDTSGATVTVPVSATIVKGGVKVYAAVTSGAPLVVLLKNGGTTVETINAGASGGQFYSSSTYSGPITSLVISRTGRAPEFNAIGINGIILKDDSTTNLDFGTNGFYLPMDGNSPIGQDKSGKGNDFIPVNFGGSVELDKATGALPILNTTQGGSQAGVGVREDSLANGDPSDPLDRVFSNFTTSTNGFNDSYPKTNLFDGQAPADANRAEAASNNVPIDITFNPAITVSSTISLWSGKSSTKYQINNSGSYTTYSDAVGSYKDISHSGSLSNIKILHGDAANNAAGLSAIKIDGTQLVDTPGLVLALPLIGNAQDVSSQLKSPLPDKTLTRLRFRTDWNWMYVSAIEINGTILTTGTLDNSGGVWSGGDNWKNGSVGNGAETYSQSARGDWFDVTLASTIEFEKLRIYVYLDSSSGSSTNVFELELFFQDGSTLTQINPTYDDAPNGNYNQRSWQDYGDVRTKYAFPSGSTASSTQSNFYNGSFIFDGSNDFIRVPDSQDFNLAGNDWTIEAWVYHSSTNYASYEGIIGQFIDSSGTARTWILETVGAGATSDLEFYYYDTSNNFVGPVQGGTLTKEKWHHVAACRSGNTVRIFIDGVMYGTGTSINVNIKNATNDLTIGGNVAGAGYWNGHIQDARVYNGVAKYTSNFIPAATSPDVLPDTPSGVSGSSKLAKITDGAVAFDGSGDYLSTPHVASTYEWWDTPFTLEYYVYPNAFGVGDNGNTNMVGKSDPGGNPESWSFGAQADGTVEWYYWVGSQKRLTTTDAISLKKWTHLAFTHDGSNGMKIFIDGKVATSGNIDGTPAALNTSLPFNIGKNANAAFNGMISNLRMVRGTALYTTNFTPPTRELTDVTNTKLLCCQSPTSATEGAVKPGNITANGDAAATNFNPFNTDINTVRGQETGYATLNPLQQSLNSTPTISNGNLTLTKSAGSSEWTNTGCTMTIPKSGKWFWEITWTSVGGGSVARCGVADSNDYEFNRNTSGTGLPWLGSGTGTSWSCDVRGYKYNGGTETTGYLPAFVAGDVMGIILDRDNNTITYTRNGVSGGVAHSNVTPEFITPGFGLHAGTTNSFDVNFGQKPFKFPPPDGFQPLNAANLRPETVITRPDHYVGVTTYTAAGADQIITLGFKPDLIISKSRDNNYAWDWEDILRGGGFKLRSNTADSQTDYSSNAPIREWRRDGVRCSTNMNAAYGSGDSVSYGFVAGNTAIPECGAISFDGTGDYLTFASTSAFHEDAGYTIDGWIYLLTAPANSNGEVIFDTGSGGSDPELNVYADGSGNIQLYESLSNNTNWNGGAPYMKVGQWHYFKQTVDGSSASDASATHKLYIDGQLGVTNTINLSSRTASSTAAIAARTDGSVIGNFILSNLRYRDAVDNSTDVPTAPFTGSEANTVLLCCNKGAPASGSADPTDSTITPSTITKQGNPGNANITIFGRFTKDGVAHASAAAAGITGGSITPTGASVGTKQGFSIIKYTGTGSNASVSHGLQNVPQFIIVKDLDSSSGWWSVYHHSMGNTHALYLNDPQSKVDSSFWNDTTPTSSVFTIGANANTNSSNNFISYLWHDVPGLQKFGSYEGNESTNGPYVELGFRPAILLVKNADESSNDWKIYDGARNPHNVVTQVLYPNAANDEDANTGVDFLSNGFKWRDSGSAQNGAETIIYAAWAEAPASNLYGAQSNAR